jgi:hypothetical protein
MLLGEAPETQLGFPVINGPFPGKNTTFLGKNGSSPAVPSV